MLKLRSAGGHEFENRPVHYIVGCVFSQTRQPIRFSHPNMPFQILNLFGMCSRGSVKINYRPSAPFLYEVASRVNNAHYFRCVALQVRLPGGEEGEAAVPPQLVPGAARLRGEEGARRADVRALLRPARRRRRHSLLRRQLLRRV